MSASDNAKTNDQLRAELSELRLKAARLEEAGRIMRESGERYRRLLESVSDYVYTVRVENGRAVSTAHGEGCKGVTGYDAAEYANDPHLWINMVPEQDRDLVRDLAARLERGEPTPPFEHRIVHKDGGVRWVRNTPVIHRDALGRVAFYDGVVQDITGAKLMEQENRHASLHDALTGLPNRILLMAGLERLFAEARRQQAKVAILFLDLDNFKPVNDTLGHAVGDEVLKEAAQRLVAQVRTSDMVARVGGDEFVVVLPGLRGEAGAAEVAKKIIETLARPYVSLGSTKGPGASIGVAMYPDDGHDPLELIKKADAAMYYVKNHRRGCYAFNARMTQAALCEL